MSTTAKTWAAWIIVLLLLCAAVDASAANGFLSENSRQEKNLGQAEIHREIATVNAESQRVCDDSCFEHAADFVVAPKSGLTMLGGTPLRLASTQAEIDALYKSLLEVAKSPTFIARARKLGFTEEQISQLSSRITKYYESGNLGWIKSGGWADESNLLIGKGGLPFSQTGRMRHELGHVLDEIANPGLMARSTNPKTFGFFGYFNAEMTAFGTQLNPYNPARPWLAGLTASHNRFGYWGSLPYIAGSTGAVGGIEYLLLELLDQ